MKKRITYLLLVLLGILLGIPLFSLTYTAMIRASSPQFCSSCHEITPDYAWWHGFYECKKRFNTIKEKIDELVKSGKPAPRFEHYPGATGSTALPAELQPPKR